MTTTRRLAQLGAVSLLMALLTGPAGPSSALERTAGLRVGQNETVAQEYPPMPVFNPAPDNPRIKPEDCRTAPWCDVIPLEVVVPPTVAPEDEYFVRVKLEWETENIPSNPLTPETTAVNDLDLYVWEDPQEEGDVELAMGATNQQPEELALFRPNGRYLIVVVNYLGPNTGYRLTANYKPEPIVPPFESLEPVFELPPLPVEAPVPEPPEEIPEPEPEELPADTSGEPAFEVPAPVETPAAPAVFDPVPVEADPDFEGFDDSEFEDALAAPAASDILAERKARVLPPPKPASTPSLVFWMALVPLGLAAGAGFWLTRRGSAVLRVK